MSGRIVQSGDIYVYAYFAASGVGATGLAPVVYVDRNRAGTMSAQVSAAASEEISRGRYRYKIDTSIVNGGDDFIYTFYTTGTADQKEVCGFVSVDANWTAARAGYLDSAVSGVAASVQSLLTSQTITVRSPVLTRGSIEVVIGTSYRDTDGVPLEWDIGSTPDLTGFTLYAKIGGVTISTCSITNAGAATQTLTLEPTAAETATMVAGLHDFIVYAINTTPNPDATVALVWGKVNVIDAGL